MKKTRERIAKALVAFMVAGLMAAPVSAAGIGDSGVYTGNDTTLTIPKGIIVNNDGYTQSYCPNITFSFAIAPATVPAGTTITDSQGNSISVTAGVANGVSTTATAEIAAQNVVESDASATSLSEQVSANMTLSVDLTQFTTPGVYRYTITDTTTNATLLAAGIVRPDDYDTTRELDVYIERNATDGTLGVAGYALSDDIPGNVVADTLKSPGYVEDGDIVWTREPGTDGELGTADDVWSADAAESDVMDQYTTYNLDLNKVVTGNMGDVDHDFPFSIAIANSVASGLTVDSHVFVGDDTDALALNAGTSAIATVLADGDNYYVYGLNPYAVVTVTETNDTANVYKTTISDGSAAAEAVNPNAQISSDGIAVSDYATVNSASDVSNDPTASDDLALTFTNNLQSPSVTGFVARIAPFIALIGVVGGLFGISKVKAKKQNEGTEES